MIQASHRFKPFDVVVVPFCYADRLAEKRRPEILHTLRSIASFEQELLFDCRLRQPASIKDSL
jgi:hypothetical protein